MKLFSKKLNPLYVVIFLMAVFSIMQFISLLGK